MYRKYVNARSPLRLLEKGLHGGLGLGNLGALVAGTGVGKSSFLVGVATDELLRGGTVLHVAVDQTVAHVRDYYDTVFEALASSTHLEDAASTHLEIDKRRRIRSYKAGEFNASKLAEAVKLEIETGAKPSLMVLDGLSDYDRDTLADIRALARDLQAEVWLTASCESEVVDAIPADVAQCEDLISVVLALEPRGDELTLRALKDHENEDLRDLHVGLDPKTLLLVRA